MTAQDIKKSDAIRLINTIAKANKMINKRYESLYEDNIYPLTDITLGVRDYCETQMSNVRTLAELIGMPLIKEQWASDPKYDIEYFDFKGTRFFKLYNKEEEK